MYIEIKNLNKNVVIVGGGLVGFVIVLILVKCGWY